MIAWTESQTELRNIDATKASYAAVPAGDLDTALAHLDPDVHITYYGTEKIPCAGDYRGIDGAMTFFGKVGQAIEIIEMEAWKFIAQGGDLATWGRQRFRRLATGDEWESEFAHIITLRNGRWLHFRDFMNSALHPAGLLVKVAADREICMPAGMCVMTADEFFDQDADGIVLPADDQVPAGPDSDAESRVRRAVIQAVKLRPSGALRLVPE